MSKQRIIFQDWIVQIGFDPGRPLNDPDDAVRTETERDANLRAEISREVTRAIKQLTENEKEFIRQYYYMGRTYQQLSDATGRKIYRLEALHDRAVRKLKKLLTPYVQRRFGAIVKNSDRADADEKPGRDCAICKSEHRHEIDQIISGRDRTDTWKPIIQRLKAEFNITVRSPQQLIGHEKYH